MKTPVLLVGNFLSAANGSRCVCEELAGRLRHNGRRVLTTSHQRRRLFRLIDMVTSAIKWRGQYAVAHVEVYSGTAFIWAEAVCAALAVLRKPVLFTLHGGNLPAFARAHPARVERLLRRARVITAPSNYLREEMRAYCDDLRLIPNALELDHYPFRLRSHPVPRLVWLRAFHSVYNPGMAPRVLAGIHREFPDAELTMVGPDKGDGSYEQTCTIAEQLGVRPRLHLPGAVPKATVPRWLSRGDIFLNTTNVDNTPVSVLEALATGLCVVSTDAGGLRHLLEDGRNALLIKPKDSDSMTVAVKTVLNDLALAERLSRNARLQAEAYDWSLILPQWEALLDKFSCN